jgi:tetratricopeptide (TPR) repeat protein
MIQRQQGFEWINFTQNKLITILILLTLATTAFPESPYKKSIYTAFITHDMAKWEKVIRIIEARRATNTINQKLELINYYYGYIGWLIGQKKFAQAAELIPKGEKLINEVLKISPENATAYSFKGSFTGFKIGIDKCKAIFLGSESRSNINKAILLDPQNLQAIIDKGNLLFYSPRIFGGDKNEALNYFLKGERIMERNNETYQNWVYLNLLTMIATVYEKTNKLEDAKLTYEKIMRNEPDIKWVKNDLYPQLLAKIKS